MVRNLAYEGIEAFETDEKEIDTVLNQLNENINLKRPEIYENPELRGYGRGRGLGYGRGYGRGLGYGRGFGRGLGYGRGLGFGRRMGYGRGFGRRWFD
jgi:hypothetical protein